MSFALAQLLTFDLAGRCLGKRRHELNAAGIFEAGHALLGEFLQLLFETGPGRYAGAEARRRL